MQNTLMTESEYPYTAQDGTCQYTQGQGQVTLSNAFRVTPMSVTALKAALNIGPVGIAVEANNTPFMHYTGGLVDEASCGTSIDHAVDAVGYGTYGDQEYLMVRNSWGPNWGDNGYIYIALNDQNICSILTQPYYPEAKAN